MKTLITAIVLAVAAAATAQQTNTLATLQQAQEKQQQSVLEQYGKALDTIVADLKKKGDLDNVLFLQAEQKRFEEEKTVPTPKDAMDSFRPAAEAYCKSMVTLLRQYMKALDELIKQEVTADRIEEAKLVKAEKDKADFMLADMQTKLPMKAVVEKPKKGVPTSTLRDGLVLHFSFDKDEGRMVTDRSAATNNGSVLGAKWIKDSKRGGCYRFGGGGERIEVAHSESLSFDQGMTFSVWAKIEGDFQNAVLINKWTDGREDKYLGGGDDGRFHMWLFTDPGSIASKGRLASERWYHIVLTYDGVSMNVYIDGQLDNSKAAHGSIANSSGPLNIGGFGARFRNRGLRGLIGEVRVYNRGLSKDEVRQLYNMRTQTGRDRS